METYEDQALIDLVRNYLAAWNQHAEPMVVDLFAEDGVFVDPWGAVWTGKAEVGIGFGKLFRLMPEVTLDIDLDVIVKSIRLLAPELALVEGEFENHPAGATHSLKGYQVFLLQKTNGEWRILHDNPKLYPPAYASRPIG